METRCSFWKIRPILLGKRLKIQLQCFFFVFLHLKKTCNVSLGLSICEVSAHSLRKKKILALLKRDRFPVVACRAVQGRDLNPVHHTLIHHTPYSSFSCNRYFWSAESVNSIRATQVAQKIGWAFKIIKLMNTGITVQETESMMVL